MALPSGGTGTPLYEAIVEPTFHKEVSNQRDATNAKFSREISRQHHPFLQPAAALCRRSFGEDTGVASVL
jgi:hypothetical protein